MTAPQQPYRPASDREWSYLLRRFAGLQGQTMNERGRDVTRSSNEMRRLFNEGLGNSPIDEHSRLVSRTIVRERVRDRSVEAYADPYFELEWMRTVDAHPELGTWPEMNEARDILWDAYYRRDEAARRRSEARREWHELTESKTRAPGAQAFEDT